MSMPDKESNQDAVYGVDKATMHRWVSDSKIVKPGAILEVKPGDVFVYRDRPSPYVLMKFRSGEEKLDGSTGRTFDPPIVELFPFDSERDARLAPSVTWGSHVDWDCEFLVYPTDAKGHWRTDEFGDEFLAYSQDDRRYAPAESVARSIVERWQDEHSTRQTTADDPVFSSDGKTRRDVCWKKIPNKRGRMFTWLQIRGVRLRDGRVWRTETTKSGIDHIVFLHPEGCEHVKDWDSTCFYGWDEIAAVLL